MQLDVGAAAARQDEGTQLGQIGVHPIDLGFEKLNFRGGYARLFGMHVLRPGRQDGAQIEQLVLHALEDHGHGDHRRVLGR